MLGYVSEAVLSRLKTTTHCGIITALRMTELKRTGQLIAINQARRKGSDATSFSGSVRTLVLERFSAVLIPPIFPLT
jgi:hypothetical protein